MGVKKASALLIIAMFFCCCADGEIAHVANETNDDTSQQSCTSPTRTGIATFYRWANGGGNCSFDPTPNNLMVAALNQVDYAGSSACGASIEVVGPRGRVTVRIVDQCGDCQQGHVDLSPSAFALIADTVLGIVPIKWRFVETAVQGNIVYHFKDGSNQWWTAVQVRNHRYPIAKLEYRTAQGTFKTVRRLMYNYFVEPTGMGTGPFTFRVTDAYGRALVDSGIVHTPNSSVTGSGQFPPCSQSAKRE